MANGVREYISISVLFVVNLLNYVDRYTVAGVLTDIQEYYEISDSMAGLIQTVFLVGFLIASPICGYLGDRVNRKWIIVVGVIIWLGAVFASTFAPHNMFWLFLVCRAVVGVGEASYSNVSPSMISDMFTGTARSRMYMVFYFAVPVGSGLGFVIGSNLSSAFGHWQWGIRVPACAGVVALIALVILVFEPERGAAEGGGAHGGHGGGGGHHHGHGKAHGQVGQKHHVHKATYWQELVSLITIPSFVTCTFGYTALVFVTGTISWWEPTIIEHSVAWSNGFNDTAEMPAGKKDTIGLIFGGITTVAGLLGVMMGTMIAQWWQDGVGPFSCIQTPRAKPLVSGLGALIAAPVMAVVLLFGHHHILLIWIPLAVATVTMCFNWGLNVDLLMGVITPSKRSTAFSYFMLVSHLLGDAAGPYIVGAVSDGIRGGATDSESQYRALVKATACVVPILVISAAFYLICAMCLVRDQKKFAKEMEEEEAEERKAEEEYIKNNPISADGLSTDSFNDRF